MRNNGGACLPGGMQVMNGWSCGLGCKTRGGLLTWWYASHERVVVRARVRNDGGWIGFRVSQRPARGHKKSAKSERRPRE